MRWLLSVALVTACALPARPGPAPARQGVKATPLEALGKLLREAGSGLLPGFNTWQRVTAWKAEGCRVEYVITDEGRAPDGGPPVDVKRHTHSKFTLDLGDVDPQAVEARPRRDGRGGTLSYRTTGERPSVRFEPGDGRPGGLQARGWLPLKDGESLTRAAELLKRAAAGCQK